MTSIHFIELLFILISIYYFIKLYEKAEFEERERLKKEIQKKQTFLKNKDSVYPYVKWIAPNQSVQIKNIVIRSGLIYVGTQSVNKFGMQLLDKGYFIDPLLEVIQQHDIYCDSAKSEIISYSVLSPEERGIYLNWLSLNRNNSAIDIKYVILFLYGLEHRLIIDDQETRISTTERMGIKREIQRLIQLHSRHELFLKIACNLLFLLWLQGEKEDTPPFDYLIKYDKKYATTFVNMMPLILSKYATDSVPLPAFIALIWMLSFVAQAHEQQRIADSQIFNDYFKEAYQHWFNNGIMLHTNVNENCLDHCVYMATNPSLPKTIRFEQPKLFAVADTTQFLVILKQIVIGYTDLKTPATPLFGVMTNRTQLAP